MTTGGEPMHGRVAVVTGAARGIGLAIARRLSAAGAAVALVDVDGSRVRGAAAHLSDQGRDAVAFQKDVTKQVEVEEACARVLERYGRVDVLVNNAGIAGTWRPLWLLSEDDWQRVLAVNLTGAFYWTRAVIPHMRERKYGRIVNVSSIAGKEGNPRAIPYSVSKAGLIAFTKALAKEVAREGILVNCVTPALIETDLLDQLEPDEVDALVAKIPMGRAGRAEEVAALAAWLCSDECSFSTGAVFDISGGRATY